MQKTVIGSFKALILKAVSVGAEMDAIVDGFKIILSFLLYYYLLDCLHLHWYSLVSFDSICFVAQSSGL